MERQREGETERASVSPSLLPSLPPSLPHSVTPSHTIRLRGPWTCQPIASATDAPLPSGGTLAIPGDWSGLLGADFRGRARFTRHFNCPTGLDPGQRVWLVLDDAEGDLTVYLNGADLLPLSPSPTLPVSPTSPALRCDITAHLQPRNELTIDLHSPSAPGRLGLVRLEIE